MDSEDLKWLYDNILYINYFQRCGGVNAGWGIQITYIVIYFQIRRIENLTIETCNEYMEILNDLTNIIEK